MIVHKWVIVAIGLGVSQGLVSIQSVTQLLICKRIIKVFSYNIIVEQRFKLSEVAQLESMLCY